MDIFYEREVSGESIANINALWQNEIYSQIDGNSIDNQRFPYIEGYKSAANILIKESIGSPYKDLYVYPILFMYRQYLELMFKNFYFLYENDRGKHQIFINKVGHSLEKIFKECKPLIEKYYRDKNISNTKSCLKFDGALSDIYVEHRNPDKLISIDEIEGFINKFNMVDPNSFNFRYDFNKDLTKTINTPNSIDLKELYMIMERIDECFFITYNGA